MQRLRQAWVGDTSGRSSCPALAGDRQGPLRRAARWPQQGDWAFRAGALARGGSVGSARAGGLYFFWPSPGDAEGKAASIFTPGCWAGSGPPVPTQEALTSSFLPSLLFPSLSSAPAAARASPFLQTQGPSSLHSCGRCSQATSASAAHGWGLLILSCPPAPCSGSPHLQPSCFIDYSFLLAFLASKSMGFYL